MSENDLDRQTAEALGGELDTSNVQVTDQSREQQDTLSLKDEILANLKKVNELPRDAQGRFAKTEPEGKKEQEGAADEQQPPKIQQQTQPGKEGAQQPKSEAALQPPTSWAPEAKSEFGKLPRSVQDAIAKREAEVHRGFTAQDEDRNFGKQLREVTAPYLPIIQAEGGTPVTAVQSLLNSAYILRQGTPDQKLAVVKEIVSKYKIPLDGLTASPPNPQDLTPAQLSQQGLSREEVAQIAAETQQQTQLKATVDAFAADPANKFFPQVRQHMSALLINGLASSLKDAYDQACRAHPEISSSLKAEAEAAAEEQRQAAIKAKAAAAKHAGGSVTGGPGASTTPSKTSPVQRELRDEIAHNLALITQQRI